MKKMLMSAAALALLATSCKKDDAGPSNTWTVGSNTYGAATVTAVGPTLVAVTNTGTSGNAITIRFNGAALPTANGTYDVVAGSTPAVNQISFQVTDFSSSTVKSYSSTGSGAVKANISVNGGKVSVSMPSAEAQTDGGTDKVNIAINLTQTN